MDKYIKVPFLEEEIKDLKAGDYVYLTGTVYTARDAAHKRMQEALDRGEQLPFDVTGNVIYYMGPSPAREGKVIGNLYYSVTGNRKKCELFKRRKRMEKDH